MPLALSFFSSPAPIPEICLRSASAPAAGSDFGSDFGFGAAVALAAGVDFFGAAGRAAAAPALAPAFIAASLNHRFQSCC